MLAERPASVISRARGCGSFPAAGCFSNLCRMGLDLILRKARIAGEQGAAVDIGIAQGRIAALAPELAGEARHVEQLDGRLVTAGFVETHIHLDKTRILDRCRMEEGTLKEAIAQVAAAKRAFSEEDVYGRARATLENAIVHGTTRLRTHVEVDPRIELRAFRAIARLKQDYAWAVDIQI